MSDKVYSERIYHFELPYSIPAAYIIGGLSKFKSNGLFDNLPEDLQTKIMNSYNKWYALRVHKKDLDRIDDNTWSQLASMLDLKWEIIKSAVPEVKPSSEEDSNIAFDPEGSVRNPKEEK